MTKSLPPILLALILIAILAGPPALADTVAATEAPASESAAPASRATAPLESEEVLFLADTSCTPVSGAEAASPGETQEPLFVGVPCNERRCGVTEFCCNFSCSICASIFGGSCTLQFCQ